MGGDSLHGTTRAPPRRSSGKTVALAALTVVGHADPTRVGDRVTFALEPGTELAVSRLAPEFQSLSTDNLAALEDPFVSRKPIQFQVTKSGAIQIDTVGTKGLRIDGAVVMSALIDRSALDKGVVCELSERVVLVLHSHKNLAKTQPSFELVGASTQMAQLRNDIARLAALDIGALIRGETGTGKELVAAAIHRASSRSNGPYVCVNMATLSPTTATAELFGHTKGAFTGAARERKGFFGEANGGTLFLDEIGETPPDVQPMLLRALETSEVQPVGRDSPISVDVRIIAATDAPLEAAITTGAFRQALYHRLAGFEFRVPALRDRRDDIGRLLLHFLRAELGNLGALQHLNTKGDCPTPWLGSDVVARLAGYDWPGNVRQLRNVARQLAVSCADADHATLDPALISEPTAAVTRAHDAAAIAGENTPDVRAPSNLSEINDDALVAALRDNDWRPSAAAVVLGISRTSIYQLIERSTRVRKAADLTRDEIEHAAASSANSTATARLLEVSKRALLLRMKQLDMN